MNERDVNVAFAQLVSEEFPAWDLQHNPEHEDLYEPAYVPVPREVITDK